MAFQTPSFYDPVLQVVRPLDPGDNILPTEIPLSQHPGNILQILPDGAYVGSPVALPSAVYINNTTGTDTPTSGTFVQPYQTIDYAISQLVAVSVDNQLRTSTTLALQAGQTFPMSNNIDIYGGTLTFTFYGDPNYGNFNGPPIGTGAQPSVMTDLARPIIVPAVSNVSTYWYMAGVNVHLGNVSLLGVHLQLPVAPAQPSILLYSNSVDFVRAMNYSPSGYLNIEGSIINYQDSAAFFGVLGINARAASFNLTQFASQFQVEGILLNSNVATSAQLEARKYFIKFYPDYVGNNQQQGFIYETATTTTPASGLLRLLWADTASFTVETTKTNLASFPIAYDLTYGLRNYFYNITYDDLNRPINVLSSRTI